MKHIFGLAVLIAVSLLAKPAAAQEDAYERIALGVRVDEHCGFLNYVENRALQTLEIGVRDLAFKASQGRRGGNFTKFTDGLPEHVKALGCGDEGKQAVADVHVTALSQIAIAIFVIRARNQIPLPDTIAKPTPLELKMAAGLEGYLIKVLGREKAVALAKQARTVAANQIRSDFSLASYHADDVMGDAYFEQAAEAAGWRPVAIGGPWVRLNPAKSADDPVFLARKNACLAVGRGTHGFSCQLLVRDHKVQAFLSESVTSKGTMLQPGEVRLYIRKDGARRAYGNEWRDSADRYDGTKTADTFLGQPVYDFPPETNRAFFTQEAQDTPELAVAVKPGGDDGAKQILRNQFDMAAMVKMWMPAAP